MGSTALQCLKARLNRLPQTHQQFGVNEHEASHAWGRGISAHNASVPFAFSGRHDVRDITARHQLPSLREARGEETTEAEPEAAVRSSRRMIKLTGVGWREITRHKFPGM